MASVPETTNDGSLSQEKAGGTEYDKKRIWKNR